MNSSKKPVPPPAPKPAPKPTPDSEIPSEARELMRQKEKDAAFEGGEKARKKSMGQVFAKGGVTRADGCAKRGKTKGRFV